MPLDSEAQGSQQALNSNAHLPLFRACRGGSCFRTTGRFVILPAARSQHTTSHLLGIDGGDSPIGGSCKGVYWPLRSRALHRLACQCQTAHSSRRPCRVSSYPGGLSARRVVSEETRPLETVSSADGPACQNGQTGRGTNNLLE